VISGKAISVDETDADTRSYEAEAHDSWIELLRYWGRTPSVDILDDESMLRVYLGPTVGGWNCVSHFDVDPKEADDRIYEAIRFFRPYNRPFLWYVTPSTRPKDIGARLIDFGFSHMEDSPGMVAEMTARARDDLVLYPILEEHSEGPLSFVYDSISDYMLSRGFNAAYGYTKNLLERINEGRITGLFLLNPEAHDTREVSAIRSLFSNQITFSGIGLEIRRIV